MPAATELYCQVEVPKGAPLLDASRHDPEAQGQPDVRCPADWCHFPDTIAPAGAPLAATVCVAEPGAPGRQVAVRPIALLRTQDGRDKEIVICVPLGDPSSETVESIHQVPRKLRDDIERFAASRAQYRADVRIEGWFSREDALTAIDDAAARWAAR
jgi:inorganic pyrophosphatase